MTTWLLIAVAGAVGAVCRFLVDNLVSSWTRRSTGVLGLLPWGTICVNVTGAFAAGVVAGAVAGAVLSDETAVVVAGGFLGAYTTLSTAMYETLRLAERAGATTAIAELAAHAVTALIAAGAGWLLVA